MGIFLTADNTGLPAQSGSAVANGYTYLPGGLILNWNILATANSTANTVTFALAFPTGVLGTWSQPTAANNTVIMTANATAAVVTGASAVSNSVYIFALGH